MARQVKVVTKLDAYGEEAQSQTFSAGSIAESAGHLHVRAGGDSIAIFAPEKWISASVVDAK